jgi:hypothetical protein
MHYYRRQLDAALRASGLPPNVLHCDGRYYRDQKQAPPKLEAEEVAEPAEERKPLDPEQLLREAEEQAGSLDDVRTALRRMPSSASDSNSATSRAALSCCLAASAH